MDAGKHGSSLRKKQLCFCPASAILTALPRSSLHLLCWLSRVLAVQPLNGSKETEKDKEGLSYKSGNVLIHLLDSLNNVFSQRTTVAL